MIAAALLLAAQAGSVPAAPQAAEPIPEIVVLANLRSLQVSVGQDREGKWHCSMNKSTGRPKLDNKFCKAVTKCVRKSEGDQQAADTCIRERRSRLVRSVERAMKKNAG